MKMARNGGSNRRMYGNFSGARMTRSRGIIKSPALVRSKAAGQVRK